MGFSAMFTFQLRGKHCRHSIAVMGVVDMFGPRQFKSLVVETDFIYKTKRISSQKKNFSLSTADKYMRVVLGKSSGYPT